MAVETVTPKKKSLLGSIKGAFIQEMPEAAVQSQPQPTAATPVWSAPSVVAPTPVADSKSRETLLEAIEQSQLDNYDYLKFKKSVQELATVIPDESLRFKTVFTTAKTMGVTKEKLIETANHYVLVLNEELRKFNEAVTDQVDSRIGADEQRVQSLDQTITAKHDQIKKLSEEIDALTAERTTLVTKVAQDKATLESRKTNFIGTHASMVQDIKNDIAKVSSYLG